MVSVNGVRVACSLAGSGDGLVLVHGSWDSRGVWDLVVPELSRHLRVLTYDRRGHSESAGSRGTVHDDADDLTALIEHHGLAPAHVACSSLGGNIAMRLAVRRPELFRSLALHEPPAFDLLADDPASAGLVADARELMRTVGARIAAGESEEGARLFVEGIGGPGAWEGVPPEGRALLVENAGTFREEVDDPDLLGVDVEGLGAFGRPVLITTGEGGFPRFDRTADRLAAILPNARRRAIAQSGHEPHLSRPDRYVATLLDAIGERPGRA